MPASVNHGVYGLASIYSWCFRATKIQATVYLQPRQERALGSPGGTRLPLDKPAQATSRHSSHTLFSLVGNYPHLAEFRLMLPDVIFLGQ